MVKHRRIHGKCGFQKGHKYHAIRKKASQQTTETPSNRTQYLRLPVNELNEICDSDLKMYDADRREILDIHILRPLRASLSTLEQAYAAPCADKSDRYKIVHQGKLKKLLSDGMQLHLASSPNCKGVVELDNDASVRRGFGWKERLICLKCGFTSPYQELYNTLPPEKPGKPGPKRVDLNYTCHGGLFHTGSSSYAFALTMAAMNAPGPQPHSLQRTANVMGTAVVAENERDMRTIRDSLRRNNQQKGLPANAGINMAVDARYNNRIYSNSGNSPFQAGTQATQLYVEHETPGRKIINVVTKNKLCQTARIDAHTRKHEVTCPDHPGHCSANLQQHAVIGRHI